LAEFLMIEGEIIAPQHWQLTSSRIKEVRDFKKKHKLGIAISEPPRLYRRLIYFSQAAMPDRIKLS